MYNLKLVAVQGGQGETEGTGRHGRLAGGCFNKEADIQVLFLVATRQLCLYSLYRRLTWVQMLSTTHCSLNATVSEKEPHWGGVPRVHHQQEKGVRSLPLPASNSWVKWQSCPLSNYLGNAVALDPDHPQGSVPR